MRTALAITFCAILFGGCAKLVQSGCALPPSNGSFHMKEMLPQLSTKFWEIPETHRREYLAAQYPNFVPDDFINLVGSGAQPDIQALRLDASTLAIASGTERSMGYADGDHQIGYNLSMMRLNQWGWEDLTATVFPFTIPPHGKVVLSKDGMVTVQDEYRKHTRRYRFDGVQFVRLTE